VIGLSHVSIGARSIRVTLDVPGVPVPDGDGGWTSGWELLDPPTLFADIQPASARDLERVTSGVVRASANLLITMPFHPRVTLQTRVSWTDAAKRPHTAGIVGIIDRDSRCVETTLAAVEVVT
jgi:hypothetical protein